MFIPIITQSKSITKIDVDMAIFEVRIYYLDNSIEIRKFSKNEFEDSILEIGIRKEN